MSHTHCPMKVLKSEAYSWLPESPISTKRVSLTTALQAVPSAAAQRKRCYSWPEEKKELTPPASAPTLLPHKQGTALFTKLSKLFI